MLLKILPILFAIGWLYWHLTAQSRLSASLRRNSAPLDDWALIEKIQAFSKALESKPFEVRILDFEPINALALPDGGVYVSRGLYDKYLFGAASRDELAAVIAHEIGHVALGHGQRRVEVGRAQLAIVAVVGFLFGRLLFGWIGLLAWLGISAFNSRAAQRQEFEADAFAAQLLMRAGVDPRATISMLNKVRDWGGAAPDQPAPFRWFTTHPPLEERIAWLEQVIAAGAQPPLETGRLSSR